MLSVEEIAGVDLDPRRRPGHQAHRPVGPWPHTRYPPVRQPGHPASLVHGRAGKEPTPVFGTANPPRGISGAMRRLANRFPDHQARHWLILLAADRVEATKPRMRRLGMVALPLLAAGAVALRRPREAGDGRWRRGGKRVATPAPVLH